MYVGLVLDDGFGCHRRFLDSNFKEVSEYVTCSNYRARIHPSLSTVEVGFQTATRTRQRTISDLKTKHNCDKTTNDDEDLNNNDDMKHDDYEGDMKEQILMKMKNIKQEKNKSKALNATITATILVCCSLTKSFCDLSMIQSLHPLYVHCVAL